MRVYVDVRARMQVGPKGMAVGSPASGLVRRERPACARDAQRDADDAVTDLAEPEEGNRPGIASVRIQ